MTTLINIRYGGRCDELILRPSIYSNPFVIGVHGDRTTVLKKYEQYLQEHPEIVERARTELTGKVLGCVCLPKPCHGLILIRAMERLL